MARLDVTDIVMDPDLVDRMVCERIEQVVGDNGLAVNTPTRVPLYGVVTSADGNKLSRGAGGERIAGSIVVHTKFRLQDGSKANANNEALTADVICWDGSRYTVSLVNDYSHYGRGFTAAKCDLIPLAGSGPGG